MVLRGAAGQRTGVIAQRRRVCRKVARVVRIEKFEAGNRLTRSFGLPLRARTLPLSCERSDWDMRSTPSAHECPPRSVYPLFCPDGSATPAMEALVISEHSEFE